MNLEDLINTEHGLQQDEWSLASPEFGGEGQLEVVGWSGRSGTGKYYILKCGKCSLDSELFGGGYFRSLKSRLMDGQVPCGCSKSVKWSKEQYHVLCTRKAVELGYTFLDFVDEWRGAHTKIKMSCDEQDHGEWSSGHINGLVHNGTGCPGCRTDAAREAKTKPDSVMVASFLATEAFHPDTRFWRSERLDSQGWKRYWHMSCPECGEGGDGASNDLQKGQRPCACSKQRQLEAYINWIVDECNNAVAIKFGIANISKRRVKEQNSKSAYEVRQYQVYSFPTVQSCKQAERGCKKSLTCGVVLKRDMPDGYTETTHVYNLDKIIEIYELNGGTLIGHTC